MQGRLLFRDQVERERAAAVGIKDFGKLYNIEDMVKSDVIFCATGVTSGWMLGGVEKSSATVKTSHLMMHRSASCMRFLTETDFLWNC